MSARHSRRAGAALRRLSEEDPALGALALWCPHRDSDERAQAAWTDGRSIFYGRGFEDLAPHEQVGLAGHQVLHLALRHGPRAQEMRSRFGDRYDDELFNIACDAILNQTLVEAGHCIPRPAILLPDLLKAALPEETRTCQWDAEGLYIRLQSDSSRAGKGKGGGDGKGKGSDDSENARRDAAEAAKEFARQKGFDADLEPCPGPVEGDEDECPDASDWQDRITRAMEAGRSAGRGIGTLSHKLLDLPQVGLPHWERLLRRMISKAVTQVPRPDWGVPARRWLAADSVARAEGRYQPPFQPSRRPERNRIRVAIGVDTSTSIDDARLSLFAAQVAGIGRRTGAEVHVLAFDTVVSGHTKMQGMAWESEIQRVSFARGGGTDFRPVIQSALELDPSVIVMLTDLDGPCGPAPKVPVIWAVPQDDAPEPPFGRVISLAR
ncbi:VWA-like domain-containing protein [Cereibacter azotoformans]|uniref:vWA domain-containing protein n=1 Tax=Cereibacter azotoformans TaxID=43057 RepID=UPI001EEBAB01|nr:VWA-like domain-containing protein [Cereibacter azotoformans]ULB09542.1 VWA-like domain-containing protein [Cereibacter azotoformans]